MTREKTAFTLVELMIVVVIIAALSSIGVIQYYNILEKSRSAEANAVLADIASAETAYHTEYDAFTTTWSDLDRYDSAPLSDNFTYSLQATFARATPRIGATYYQMCYDGSYKWHGNAATGYACPS